VRAFRGGGERKCEYENGNEYEDENEDEGCDSTTIYRMKSMTDNSTPTLIFQTDFAPAEFAGRRAKICRAIGPEAHALLQGVSPTRAFEVFRQTNQFYYCCGVETPQACLLISGADGAARLFLPHRPERSNYVKEPFAANDAEEAQRRTGVDAVFGLEELTAQLENVAALYTPHQPAENWKSPRDSSGHADRLVVADPWDGTPSREERLMALLRERRPGLKIRDLSPILDDLRAVKSPAELTLLREAGRLSALAVTESMRATRPGLSEGQLDAIAEYVFVAHGARGQGYRTIVASGANVWDGHYCHNDCAMQDGDLVLMDGAPDYRYYTSDIGRMWPVNGTYASWQRELYGFIVEYHKALLERVRPGLTADEIHAAAAVEMRGVIERTEWSKDIYREAAVRALDFKGHLSHPVGMSVHDVGGYRDKTLWPGLVFTIDPQLWIPEERKYIRVEDTVAVTEDGLENLTGAAPLELDAVEAEMRQECAYPIYDC
jgi:Xaa-Pro aminopeptidase